jgi:hypothetical protein
MAKRRHRRATPQEDVGRALNSPLLREQLARKQRLQDTPEMRGLAEQMRQLQEWQQAPAASRTLSAKRRRKGGGRKDILSPEAIARLQDFYRPLAKDPKLAYTQAEKRLRRRFPKETRGVSLATLKRHVFWPVRARRSK